MRRCIIQRNVIEEAWSTSVEERGTSRIVIERRVRCARVPRVALYCGLSRFRNFVLWCRFGRTDKQEGLAARRTAGVDWEGWSRSAAGLWIRPFFTTTPSKDRPHTTGIYPATPTRDFRGSKRSRRERRGREKGRKRAKDGRRGTHTDGEKEKGWERENEGEKDRRDELRWGQESYRGGESGEDSRRDAERARLGWSGQKARCSARSEREEAEKERRSARQRGWERESVREFTFVYLPDVAQYGVPTLDSVHRLDAVLSPLNRVLQDLFRIFHLSFQ